jgi:pyruvate dehydrogenase E1 component alpha subunit
MSRRSSANDDREIYQVLDEDGVVVSDDGYPELTDEELVRMYTDMAFVRHFDERAISLQRQGRMGTYPPIAGHEATQIASTYALHDDDWILPTYRESAVALARDVPADDVLRYWMGHEDGNDGLADQNIFPINIVIGALVPHAVGMAMAIDYKDEDRVVLCHFGDGATSQGDVHEGMNFAGVFDVPTVFFCNNNQYAISVPRDKQTASATIAQKATAYGIDGVRVDGMDPLAVYEITRNAVEKARNPEGECRPTLIEAVQYRFGAHTTADDPSVYRDEEEVAQWRRKDPLDRLRKFLQRTGRITDAELDAIHEENTERLKEAIDIVESAQPADPQTLFEHVFDQQTVRHTAQSRWLASLRERHGDDALTDE